MQKLKSVKTKRNGEQMMSILSNRYKQKPHKYEGKEGEEDDPMDVDSEGLPDPEEDESGGVSCRDFCGDESIELADHINNYTCRARPEQMISESDDEDENEMKKTYLLHWTTQLGRLLLKLGKPTHRNKVKLCMVCAANATRSTVIQLQQKVWLHGILQQTHIVDNEERW